MGLSDNSVTLLMANEHNDKKDKIHAIQDVSIMACVHSRQFCVLLHRSMLKVSSNKLNCQARFYVRGAIGKF